MIYDVNPKANARLGDYNLHWLPTCYVDGGRNQVPGHIQSALQSAIISSGNSAVNDIDLSVEVTWLGGAQIEVTVHVENHQFFNSAPNVPNVPDAPDVAVTTQPTEINASSTDGDGHDLWYQFSWGDGNISDWIGPYPSGDVMTASYAWSMTGSYSVKVKVKDEYDAESANWSPIKTVDVIRIGDTNDDGTCNVGDAVFLINYVFKGGTAPDPVLSGDANCDGGSNVGDAVYIINFVFKGGTAPGCTQ